MCIFALLLVIVCALLHTYFCIGQNSPYIFHYPAVQAALKCGMKDNIIDDALSLMTEAKVKDRLKSVTQEALDLGVSTSFSFSVCVSACLPVFIYTLVMKLKEV